MTLEHAYADGNGGFIPKVAAGTYTCLYVEPTIAIRYPCFELQNVPPFQGCSVDGIKIHVLNFNGQSEGCIGIGLAASAIALLESQVAFNEFMALQSGVTQFQLKVLDPPSQ